ncbi:hypothetical protein [Alkalihalophilus marmarensis]|uniref:hypothetical protein n=1 Tax=Alkalihalophilus marmarensis TaxID=521377 RepID=UPI002E1D3CB1|nr:hypothetical protein [Alkalihalophilus marmarensis]
MSWNRTFIESLKEWDGNTSEKSISINDVAVYLGLTIGGQDPLENIDRGLAFLEERINYLVEKESIQEQFLVESLIEFTTKYLAKFNGDRGRCELALSEWEKIIAVNFSRENKMLLVNAKFKEMAKKHRDFYKTLSEEDKTKTIGQLYKETKAELDN